MPTTGRGTWGSSGSGRTTASRARRRTYSSTRSSGVRCTWRSAAPTRRPAARTSRACTGILSAISAKAANSTPMASSCKRTASSPATTSVRRVVEADRNTMLRVDNVKDEEDLEVVRDALDEIGAGYEFVRSEPDEVTYPQTAYFYVSEDVARDVEDLMGRLSEEHGFDAELL